LGSSVRSTLGFYFGYMADNPLTLRL